MVWVRVALRMCLHAVLPAGGPGTGVGERRAHLSKASSEEAAGTTQYPVSPMARKILRGSLPHTPKGCKAVRRRVEGRHRRDEGQGCW